MIFLKLNPKAGKAVYINLYRVLYIYTSYRYFNRTLFFDYFFRCSRLALYAFSIRSADEEELVRSRDDHWRLYFSEPEVGFPWWVCLKCFLEIDYNVTINEARMLDDVRIVYLDFAAS